jgi:hypothetical protein
MTTDRTPAEPEKTTPKAEDRLFIALLTSQTEMPSGGWYSLIDEVRAEAAAQLAEQRSINAALIEALREIAEYDCEGTYGSVGTCLELESPMPCHSCVARAALEGGSE